MVSLYSLLSNLYIFVHDVASSSFLPGVFLLYTLYIVVVVDLCHVFTAVWSTAAIKKRSTMLPVPKSYYLLLAAALVAGVCCEEHSGRTVCVQG